MSMLRLAPFVLFVACTQPGTSPNPEPISPAETAAATSAVESAIVAISPINSTNAASIAASFQAMYPQVAAADGGSCVTIETNNLTFVTVTFACQGLFATTGTLHVEITSLTTVEAVADLTIGNVAIDGSVTLTVPASSTSPRTLDGDLVIAGPNRELVASANADWLVTGKCVTFNASGSVAVGSASKSFQITNRTACHE